MKKDVIRAHRPARGLSLGHLRPLRAAPPSPADLKPTDPPAWVLGFFADIDRKDFGPFFAEFLTDDAHLRFGVHDIRGREEITEILETFDARVHTSHRVLEYWDTGRIKVLRGEVTITAHDGSPPEVPAFVHVWTLAEGAPERVAQIYGAVGPLMARDARKVRK